jgi:hypothetical protein
MRSPASCDGATATMSKYCEFFSAAPIERA